MNRSRALLLASLLIGCGRSELIAFTDLEVMDEGEAGNAAPAMGAKAGSQASGPARAGSPAPAPRAGSPAPVPEPAGSRAPDPAGSPALEPIDPPPPDNTRWILDGELENARDLGGIPLASGETSAYDVLFRGPPLADLSPMGCAAVSELPIRTVIDLRVESETLGRPEDRCVSASANVVFAPLPIPYDVSPQAYLTDLGTTDSIATIFRVLGDPMAYPVYFHCTYGRDRTGVVAALILRTLGASRDDVMGEYLLSRLTVGAYPNSLVAVLDEIDRRGGPDQLLAESGVTPEQIAVLRKHAIAH